MFPGKDQSQLIVSETFAMPNLRDDVFDFVEYSNFKRNRFSIGHVHEDLHGSMQAQATWIQWIAFHLVCFIGCFTRLVRSKFLND